jgi:hypothetical protein
MKKTKWLCFAILFFLVFLLGPQTGYAEEIELQVIVQKANVRAKPDIESEIITQVSLGTILKSDKKEGNWYRIILPPDQGGATRNAYIHSSIVEVMLTAKEAIPKAADKKEQVDSSEADTTLTQKLSAIPLTLNLHYAVPIGNSLRLGVFTGIGYYLGKVIYENKGGNRGPDFNFESNYIAGSKSASINKSSLKSKRGTTIQKEDAPFLCHFSSIFVL